jgi:hypothetical protein
VLIRLGLLLSWLFLAAAAPVGTADVKVHLTKEAAHAAFLLDRPVTRFYFAPADTVRKGDFELVTPGLAFDGSAVTGAVPFRRFEFRIKPAPEERDAKYPAHFRIGTGGVVFAPALLADPASWRTHLDFVTGTGEVRLPSSRQAPDGFVFIGPAALRTDQGGMVAVTDPAMPAWLADKARASFDAAIDFFAKSLRTPLGHKPLLLLKHQDGERNFNVGDVTPGAVTSLRFHGPAWTKPDERAARGVQEFIFHEAFHFWNGGVVRHAADAPTWLHEGGAEYAALLAARQSGVLNDEEVRQRLSGALQRCQSGLQNRGDKGMSELGFLPNQVRYPCGMILQWAADLHVRGASGGRRTVMDSWAAMIGETRRRPSRTYGLQDFYGAAGLGDGAGFRPASLLVKTSGPARWLALAGALEELGAEVDQRPTAEGRRMAMLLHLLRQNCSNLPEGTGYGFYADRGAIRLDNPPGCGALAGNPVLKSIEGGDPFAVSGETYAAVARKCVSRASVTLVTGDGRTLEAACSEPLPPEPRDYFVTRWLAKSPG